jgi:hypothetical protein
VIVGLAVVDFIHAVSWSVVTFVTTEAVDDSFGFNDGPGSLTVTLFGHPLYLATIVTSALTLAAAIAGAIFIVRRLPADDASEA